MPLHSLRDGQRAAIDPIPGTGSAEHAIRLLDLGKAFSGAFPQVLLPVSRWRSARSSEH